MKRIVVCLTLFCSLAFAGYRLKLEQIPVRTLPPEIYAKLVQNKSTKALCWAWKDEDYDHSLGFSVKEIAFRSQKELPARFQEHLRTQIGKLEDAQSPYKLTLSVVDYGEITAWPKAGFVVVEGVITLFGTPMAAFATSEIVVTKDEDGYKLQYAIDDILKSFVGEIMLPSGGENIIPLAHPCTRDITKPVFQKSEANKRLQEGIAKLDEKNGFRNRRFGMSIDTFLGHAAKPEQKKGLTILRDAKDDMVIGRATANMINYVFWKGKLARVEITFTNLNGNDQTAARVHQALKMMYGRGMWGDPIRPYLDTYVEILKSRGGVGRNPIPINPIVWQGKNAFMMLDGLQTGEDGTRIPSTISPVLLTIDSVPIVDAMRKERLEKDQVLGTEKLNL